MCVFAKVIETYVGDSEKKGFSTQLEYISNEKEKESKNKAPFSH